jgi:predicted lipid-binding transport protein (Tim44 family)
MTIRTAFRRGSAERANNAEPSPTKVVPFGIFGGGLLTGHPIGLVIVIGLLVMGIVGLPPFRTFFLISLFLGGVCGLILWLRHR